MKKYKATLFKQEYIDEPSKPIDTILRCFTSAEKFFYDKRGWKRAEHFHIEIEEMPRFLA
jgi:hypothetical protein